MPLPPLHEIFNQVQDDHPIRRFCPARVEQQGGDLELEELYYHDHQFELWSPTDTTAPHLATSEEEEFADSFFNMDCYSVKDDSHSPLPLPNHDHQVFDDQDDLIENFSIVNDVYGDVPSVMIVDEEYDLDILSSYV
ncbi:hypothetical protein F0562_008572 [Nyssa sinensis]|uniref:Uncharacterized protein n=1 Tax=Nyssa sinensis TaxID=561372 RepID=A0A5J5AA76_9ASTE|nr:hypothetical protein F0562_008572 [Nyssa sinensis]